MQKNYFAVAIIALFICTLLLAAAGLMVSSYLGRQQRADYHDSQAYWASQTRQKGR